MLYYISFSNSQYSLVFILHKTDTIGYVILREDRRPSRHYSDYIRIVDLYIEEDQRNCGHGTAVIERVTEMACNQICGRLKVACEWQNKDARRFYCNTDVRPKQVEYVQSL